MRNLFQLLFLFVSAIQTPAHADTASILGHECTIDTYDSSAESGNVGGFDGDTFAGLYRPLMDQLKASRFNMRQNDSVHRIHYFKDTEFLVELKMNSGRGANRNVSLTLVNTGKYGVYQTLFFVETPDSGNPGADAEKLFKALPVCVRAR